MNDEGLTESKVLTIVLNLMEHTHIRVGNNGYETKDFRNWAGTLLALEGFQSPE